MIKKVKITVPEQMVDSLEFILTQFINTHDQVTVTYRKELKIARRIIRELNNDLQFN